eukprot:4431795-Pyramimonas_sp.AAC.1
MECGGLHQSTLRRISFSVSPSKGIFPVSSMYAITPTLHMSLSGPYSYRSTCPYAQQRERVVDNNNNNNSNTRSAHGMRYGA